MPPHKGFGNHSPGQPETSAGLGRSWWSMSHVSRVRPCWELGPQLPRAGSVFRSLRGRASAPGHVLHQWRGPHLGSSQFAPAPFPGGWRWTQRSTHVCCSFLALPFPVQERPCEGAQPGSEGKDSPAGRVLPRRPAFPQVSFSQGASLSLPDKRSLNGSSWDMKLSLSSVLGFTV